ncbi:Uncharacterised protein [Streptococcus pneumoniae]|uniref:Uncharacterized protein n=1 Tax=Streptococcus pneumoniae TaxID=1313 RepID=A0A4J1Z8I5_STREE|nr:Uncharacterised protein [Streptococcus pneumoniae]CWF64692.1 Uncharacterised protein [Streptococcus pneumoniae]VJH96106.1 Uncharacterised protein [Streptococcus pneumoniae]VJI77554.1 Uncharacterised protein [Streptococcus pneumoniae]VKA83925.1 Uncharacterised protein [Streptococcus pneumoniae]
MYIEGVKIKKIAMFFLGILVGVFVVLFFRNYFVLLLEYIFG